MTVADSGAKLSPIPRPPRMNAGRRDTYVLPALAALPIQNREIAWAAMPADTTRRAPRRPATAPAMGAVSMIVPVHGIVPRPAASGFHPHTPWTKRVMKKMDPNMAKLERNPTAFAVVNDREANRRRSSMGDLLAFWRRTKITSSAAPTASAATIWGLPHPIPFPRIRPNTTPRSPTLMRSTQSGSMILPPERVSSIRHRPKTRRMIPIGTFSQNTAFQVKPLTIAPPTSGPAASPRPDTPDQRPMAATRRCGGKTFTRIVRVSGAIIALPMPCTARARISSVAPADSAASAEPAVNRATPASRTLRRPKRSPRAAAGIISTAKPSV
jgi:hypothetical protein